MTFTGGGRRQKCGRNQFGELICGAFLAQRDADPHLGTRRLQSRCEATPYLPLQCAQRRTENHAHIGSQAE